MIYCPQCGNPNFDDANFCDTCGEPLVRREVYEQMQSQAAAERQAAEQLRRKQAQAYGKAYEKAKRDAERAAAKGSAVAGAASGATATGAATAAGVGPSGGAVPSGAPGASSESPAEPVSFPVYKHGCVAQAWDDITESAGWAKKAFLLGIINMVPVLNFFVSGYAMDWARQLEDDKVEPMPEKIFSEGYFKQGFFAFVLNLVWGIVTMVALAIVDVIPLVGFILGIAIGILTTSLSTLSVMRTAISQELASGFEVKHVRNSFFKAGFGKALGATFAPKLIIEAIGVFICASILVIFGLTSITTISQLGSAASMSFMSSYYTSLMVELLVSLIPLLLVCYMVVMFAKALGLVWTMRATSHYIMRCCPEWRSISACRRSQGAGQGL